MLVVTVPLTLLFVAAVCDVRNREVPDWITMAILLWSVLATASGWNSVGWFELVTGALVGFGLGAVVFYSGGLGGGDVKLIAAIGAFLGPIDLMFVLFWMALMGGALAIIAALRGRKLFAYVPAITAGFTLYLILAGQWWQDFVNS